KKNVLMSRQREKEETRGTRESGVHVGREVREMRESVEENLPSRTHVDQHVLPRDTCQHAPSWFPLSFSSPHMWAPTIHQQHSSCVSYCPSLARHVLLHNHLNSSLK